MKAQNITIIGSGIAGCQAVKAIRQKMPDANISLLTKVSFRDYLKPKLSTSLAQGRSLDEIVDQAAAEFAKAQKVSILEQTKVLEIDAAKKSLKTSQGDHPYETLILALGSKPKSLAIENFKTLTHQINNIEAYEKFLQDLSGKQHISIIGSGLVGIEYAHNLLQAGFKVTVISKSETALAGLLPPQMGARLRDGIIKLGGTWQQTQAIKHIEESKQGKVITLAESTTLTTDVVITAIGIESNTTLAKQAELVCDRGIVTDEYGCTSQPHIYALGDCAQVGGLALKFIAPIRHGAAAIAKSLSGRPCKIQYPPMPVVVKTPSLPTLIVPPHQHQGIRWTIEKEKESGMLALCHNAAGKLCGFALQGKYTSQRNDWLKKTIDPVIVTMPAEA